MNFDLSILANTLISGLLLGGFYAAISIGISIAFGMLDIVNIAHPGFIMLGAYLTLMVNQWLGIDPVLIALAISPFFFLFGWALYRIYFVCFERWGQESLRGLVFFFGILFVTEVGLILSFGVDYQFVATGYTDTTWRVALIDLPLRLVVPFVVSLVMIFSIQVFLKRTYFGRAVLAVAQDRLALQLMGIDPVRVKAFAFGLSVATAGMAGAFLIVMQPVQPTLGRDYLGLAFAIPVLGGLGSIYGTLAGAAIIGLVESFTSTFFGPSWAPAVSFGLLLLALVFRPSGLLGR